MIKAFVMVCGECIQGFLGSLVSAYYMCGCQNYGPFLGTLNIRCRIIIGTQKGTIILTTNHILGNQMGSRGSCSVLSSRHQLPGSS